MQSAAKALFVVAFSELVLSVVQVRATSLPVYCHGSPSSQHVMQSQFVPGVAVFGTM